MFSKELLKNQAGIITGGSSGIGLEMARFLVDHGARVTITGRNLEKLERAKEALSGRVEIQAGDVRKSEEIAINLEHHLKKFGKVDFLINNAAGNFICPIAKMSENAFRAVNNIVLLGSFLWSKAVFEPMKKKKFGAIINIGTNYAFGQGAYIAHSGAAKAGLLNLTKSIAVEWAEAGIRSNMICPGPIIGTEGVARLVGPFEQEVLSFIPLKRMGEGWEIGAMAAFLLSPLGRYITGAILPVDGGMSLLNPGLIPPPLFSKIPQ